jgi:hypothetical protein
MIGKLLLVSALLLASASCVMFKVDQVSDKNLNILLHSINSEGRVNTIDGKTFTLDGLCNNCFYNSETKVGGCTKMFCMGGVMELEAFVFDLLKNASNLLDLNTTNGIKQGAKLVNNDKWVILIGTGETN